MWRGIAHTRARASVSAIVLSAALFASAAPAHAVVNGTTSSLGYFTVRLTGHSYCTGVVVARRLIITAAHCARRGMTVHASGGSATVAGISRSAILDDGRRISVSGDAVIVTLSAALSGSVAPVGAGSGDTFTIAGYGTTDERAAGAFGSLHEASLVAAPGRQLVDPRRASTISASACFGDSGGPVLRGGELVGIITRANYPNKRIACGYYTRWTPVSVSGQVREVAFAAQAPAAEARVAKRQRTARRSAESEKTSFNLFANWLAPQDNTSLKPKRKKKIARASQRVDATPFND